MNATPSDEVLVRYRPTAEDHLALYHHHVWSSPWYRAARVGLTVLGVVVIVLEVVRRGLPGVVVAALVGAAMAALWLLGPALARRRIGRLYQGGAEPAEVEYRLDATGVHGRAARADWKDVTRVDETDQAFLVWMRPGAGAYLPRRAMADQETALLRALFESHVGGRARLRGD